MPPSQTITCTAYTSYQPLGCPARAPVHEDPLAHRRPALPGERRAPDGGASPLSAAPRDAPTSARSKTRSSASASSALLLIDTDLGRLDVLSEVQPLGPASNLSAVELELLSGRMFRVLTLDQLIEVKAYLGRPKDRIVEVELRALRDVRG